MGEKIQGMSIEYDGFQIAVLINFIKYKKNKLQNVSNKMFAFYFLKLHFPVAQYIPVIMNTNEP
jgi:hypothetical protein